MRKFLSGAVGVMAIATMLGATELPSIAAPSRPDALKQLPTAYRFTFGDAQVMAFSDCTILIDLHQTLSGITPAETDALLAANFMTNPLETSINVFLIKRAGRTILIDTGLGGPSTSDSSMMRRGPSSTPPQTVPRASIPGGRPGDCGRMFDALAGAGVRPEQIDDILITHLHFDHSGGLVQNGQMMFPNATIHVSKPELDSYLNPPPQQDGRARAIGALVTSMVKPYLDAGKVKTFDRSGEVLPNISAKLWPGHTDGSTLYTLTSGGKELVFIGDYNPFPVVGFRHPEVTFVTDQDRAKAGVVRHEMLRDLARSGALVAAPHLGFPGLGHVGAEGSGYRWFPAAYSDRDPNLPPAKF